MFKSFKIRGWKSAGGNVVVAPEIVLSSPGTGSTFPFSFPIPSPSSSRLTIKKFLKNIKNLFFRMERLAVDIAFKYQLTRIMLEHAPSLI